MEVGSAGVRLEFEGRRLFSICTFLILIITWYQKGTEIDTAFYINFKRIEILRVILYWKILSNHKLASNDAFIKRSLTESLNVNVRHKTEQTQKKKELARFSQRAFSFRMRRMKKQTESMVWLVGCYFLLVPLLDKCYGMISLLISQN